MKLRNKKTGEILEDVKNIDTSLTTIEIYYLDNGVLRIETEKDYHSFLQNWEDYEFPQEPLIKDKNIRKVVRDWAKINAIDRVQYTIFNHPRSYRFECDRCDDIFAIDFVGWIPELKREGLYIITELCGEEE